MRIGTLFTPIPAGYYRAVDPLRVLERRGHEIVWPDGKGVAGLRELMACDVVHVYRRNDDATRKLLTELVRRGVAVTFDNDDDVSANPKGSKTYEKFGGLRGEQAFTRSLKVARMARTMTTTTDALADRFRALGVERIEVIPNLVAAERVRSSVPHDGVVVGWVAGAEHAADLSEVPVADALRRVLAEHPDVRVETIGLDLGLGERCRHDEFIQFLELPERMSRWDIGLAPLADITFNQTRSDIKVKEYAAAGIPWLASPVGPYRGLGEGEGGRIVEPTDWYAAISRLVAKGRERKKLAKRGKAWAKQHMVERAGDRWEQVFLQAVS